jgi:phage-related protein
VVYFVINEAINSRTALGLRTTEPPATPSTERIVQRIEVDGREGALTILKGWKDCDISFKTALLGADIRAKYRTAQAQIQSAKTVYFSNDPAVYYKVKTVTVGLLAMLTPRLGEFSVKFTCAPFKYQRGVAVVSMTASGTLANPGTVYSLPKITVYGTGTRTLTINGKAITLNLLSAHLILDSELKTCYFGNTAQNNLMTGDFPVLEVGNNTITLGTGITKVEIEPRWRFL